MNHYRLFFLCLLSLSVTAVGCSPSQIVEEGGAEVSVTDETVGRTEPVLQEEGNNVADAGEPKVELVPEKTVAPEPRPDASSSVLPPLRDGMKVKVRSVIDGDTVYVYPVGKTNYPYYKIRLLGFNAPECYKSSRGCYKDNEYFGLNAGKQLNDWLWKPEQVLTISCPIKGKTGQTCKIDPYKRGLAYLLLPSGENTSVKMLRAGLGWVYTIFYPPLLKELCQAEADAIRTKTGMWAQGRDFVKIRMSKNTASWYYHSKSSKTHDSICSGALSKKFSEVAGE